MTPLQAKLTPKLAGFTLIELVIGIVVLGITIVMLSVLIFPQAERSVEPILQTRAAGLGQAFINEIMSKSFDEQSDRAGGRLRCGETSAPACTTVASLGPDIGEVGQRSQFDDVDDYHGLNSTTAALENALGVAVAHRYPNFSYAIEVCYYDNVTNACVNAITKLKLVEVVVTTPQGQAIYLSALRGNF